MKALLVTAEPPTRQTVTRALSQRRHDVVACSDAATAWQTCLSQAFPLVLVDEHLPDESGLELCRRIRALPDADAGVILVLTAAVQPVDLLAILDTGADDTIAKPVDAALLAVRLAVAERRAAELERRRRTEQALGLTKLIVENSPTMLFRTKAVEGSRFVFEFVSENIGRFGYTPEEVLGGQVSYASLLHPDDRERVIREGTARVDRGDTRIHMEYRVVTKDGEVRWVDDRTTVARDADGRPIGFQGILVDITDRKQADEALRRSEERFRSLVQHASDIIMVLDPDGMLRYQSAAVAHALGYRPEEVIGANVFSLIHREDVARVQSFFAEVLRSPGISPSIEFRSRHRDRSWHYLEAIANNLLEDPSVRGIVVNCRDITARRRAEEALRESEERFRKMFEECPIGMAIISLDHRFIKVNSTLCAMLDYSAQELTGLAWEDIAHPEDAGADLRHTERVLAGELPRFQLEKRCLTKQGEVAWVNVTGTVIRGQDGAPVHGLAMIENITERKTHEAHLTRQALSDPLTALGNRTLFMDRLQHAFAAAGPCGDAAVVMFLDLDGFKAINDSFGHDAGDQLLVAVGQRLAACLRPGDTVARFGGDEFTVLLEGTSGVDDAARVAERILAAIRTSFVLGEHEVRVTTSIGITAVTPAHIQPGDVLREADVALYRAKAEGKDRYVVFDATMNAADASRHGPSPSDARPPAPATEQSGCATPFGAPAPFPVLAPHS